MFAILGLVFPLIKGLLGDGLVEKFLNHKKDLAASANEREAMNINADVKVLEFELERRKAIKELQVKEYEYPVFRWAKALLQFSVAGYWSCRFIVKTVGLDDFNIAITELSDTEAVVSMMVLTYWFLGDKIERMVRK